MKTSNVCVLALGLVVGGGIVFSVEATGKVAVDGLRVTADTATVKAVFDGPALVSLRPVDAETEFIHATRPGCPLDVYFVTWHMLGKDKHETTTVKALSDRAAVVTVKGEDSTRQLLITTDAATGDICVTPSSVTRRRGVQAVRWTMGFHPEASLVLPVTNGVRVDVARPWPTGGRYSWPANWNAQLVIAERGSRSCMIHAEDTAMTFKAINLHREGDRREIGFDTENPGPFWEQQAAGGITWRINTYAGDWKTPARRYRDWMTKAYDLPARRAARPAWVNGITLAQCWATPNVEMLDAMAALHPPEQMLIHLSDWRTDRYDINYPEYTPRPETIEYMKKARHMGFHVMPHFNYFAAYYKHPFFLEVRDFQLREPRINEPMGWHWPPDTHDYTRMGFIHPGLSLWRRKLIDVVLGACDPLGADVAFLDQTLCTWNADNGHVEGMNPTAGMRQLLKEFEAIRPDLVLVGEGLTEVSFQRQCFAQAHILDGWEKVDARQVDGTVPVCAFLWGDHCRLVGYFHLGPGDPMAADTVSVYEKMGAIPTLITNNPEHLRKPPEVVRRILDAAKKSQRPASRPDDSDHR